MWNIRACHVYSDCLHRKILHVKSIGTTLHLTGWPCHVWCLFLPTWEEKTPLQNLSIFYLQTSQPPRGEPDVKRLMIIFCHRGVGAFGLVTVPLSSVEGGGLFKNKETEKANGHWLIHSFARVPSLIFFSFSVLTYVITLHTDVLNPQQHVV